MSSKSSKKTNNGKILVIVESPAKCSKIESYLGPNYKCIASFGHIRELDGLQSIDIANQFTPSFKPMSSKSSQIQKIKTELSLCGNNVIIATDDDREGEAIGWHICDLFHLPIETTPRIVFHEITKNAIQKAIQLPGTLNMNLVHAQQARQILDLLVGYKISPQLWTHIASSVKNSLSAGRCQTPALRLVYDNQKDIDVSPGKLVYNVHGYFTKLNIQFHLEKQIESKEIVEKFLEDSVNHEHVYDYNPPKKVNKQSPTPFTTSSLQQAASNELHYSPKDTMTMCQKLYEEGYITYMRTDSKIYSEEFIQSAISYISNKWEQKYVKENIIQLSQRNIVAVSQKKKKKENNNNAQEAHEAIRPTNIDREFVPDSLHPREQKLYKLIWTNTVESCMSPAIASSLTAKISAPQNLEYHYTTELIEFPGWKIVKGYEIENAHYQYLLNIKKKSIIGYNKIKATTTMIELTSHYTEASLVKTLEEKGIGRPSTFSSLIDKIQERGYVQKEDVIGKKINCIDFELVDEELQEFTNAREFGNEKNKLVLQPLGKIVIEFLENHFNELFEYQFTKKMEDDLDIIAKGEEEYYQLCNTCLTKIDNLIESLKTKKLKKDTIELDETHTFMIGSKGPVIKVTEVKEDGEKKTSYKSVKKNIDIEQIKKGELGIEDIIDEKGTVQTGGVHLGNYLENEIIVKKGKFGLYICHGDKTYSLSKTSYKSKDPSKFTLQDMIKVIEDSSNGEEKGSGMVRKLTDDLSIRNAKYGDYIFYKNERMKKPAFLKLKGFTLDYKTCEISKILEFIKVNYNIE